MKTYEAVLSSVSTEAIVAAAFRFTSGDVPGQSLQFAPSPAAFVQEAKKQHAAAQFKPRPLVGYQKGEMAPFEIRMSKARQKFAGLPVLQEGMSYDEFRTMSQRGKVPVGAVWCAALATLFGPPVQH